MQCFGVLGEVGQDSGIWDRRRKVFQPNLGGVQNVTTPIGWLGPAVSPWLEMRLDDRSSCSAME